MLNKIAILHFNIIEKFPPVLNFIFDALEENPKQKIIVFTTKNTTSYKIPDFPNTIIYRFGTISSNPVKRYASYVWFNLMSTVVLLMHRVDKITVFETLSIYPLWLSSNFFKSMKGHIHFHEYISEKERSESSAYLKVLFKLEDQLLKKFPCSQTNEDRKQLFLSDKPFLKSEMVEIRPNMPPKFWWKNYGQFKKNNFTGKVRFVFVGACDNRTMYVKEVLDWVHANQDLLELTIISQQLDKQTKDLIALYDTKAIKVMEPIDYYDLPKELVKYDIGIVLYKGHTPNVVYSVPNKVFEYLSCGLQVIVDQKLRTTIKLGIEQIQIVDFKSLDIEILNRFLKKNIIKKSNNSQHRNSLDDLFN
jgi:hypothetical protein